MASKRRPSVPSCACLTQSQILLRILLSARAPSPKTWFTLEELENLTKFPKQCISAQLRHLRKAKYGSHKIEKRLRESFPAVYQQKKLLWEYALGDT